MGNVAAGQAVYSKRVLSIYDFWVLGFSNAFLWRCPTKLLRAEFKEHVSSNHLDVGVATGYYLDKCLSDTNLRLALLDLNLNCLQATVARISRFRPEVYQANILEPLCLRCDKFDSVSMNYLLHCLPGSIEEKSLIFKHLIPHLNDNSTVFGSTILGDGVMLGSLARKLMTVYNKKGIFDNRKDSLSELSSSLHRHFDEVEVNVVGCVAVFKAKYRSALN